ncbi:MAG: pyruvate dehydrogenase E2 component (dihydrolipoamide acetyltransferase) [Myxococcota bacterium]|jgi:pyruvate dehydrogenase E2 component (dihydrolipoamide acetyltransferase)
MAMNSTRRKLAIATWDAPREGNIYGKLTVDAEELMDYIQHKRETTGKRITVTTIVGLAVARALAKSPGLNGYIRFGQFYEHKTVDITFLVALEEGADLAKATVRDAGPMSLVDMTDSLMTRAARLRAGKDDDFNKAKGTIKLLPTFILKPLVRLTGWMASSMGWSVPALGVERFAFGSAIITSVGMFGLDEGYAPPTPFARVPVYVLVGAVKQRPTVHNGEIVARRQLTITATVDHRYMDGFQGGTLAKTIRRLLEHPWEIDGEEEPTAKAVETPVNA